MADGQVSVGASLAYAWTLWRENWRSNWGVLALSALAWTVMLAGMLANNPDLMLAGFVAVLLTQYPLYGSMFRSARAAERSDDPDSKSGALGLQWRGMEVRLLGADFLVSIFISVIVALLLLGVSAVLVGVMMSRGVDPSSFQSMNGSDPTSAAAQAQVAKLLGPQGVLAANIASFVIMGAVFFVWVRLSLSLPASAESGRVAVLRTWKLTRGNFWRILAPMVIVRLPQVVSIYIARGGAQAAPGNLSPEEIFAFSLLSGLLAGGVTLPLTAGLQAYFYRHLGPLPVSEKDDAPKR